VAASVDRAAVPGGAMVGEVIGAVVTFGLLAAAMSWAVVTGRPRWLLGDGPWSGFQSDYDRAF
jgi:hypothetical protein